RSGRAKVVCPLPPYCVPSSENNAVFCEIARICPLHSAQPLGAKLPANILISPRKGSDISEIVFLSFFYVFGVLAGIPTIGGVTLGGLPGRRSTRAKAQLREGKMPLRAIIKLKQSSGWTTERGRLPPVGAIAFGARVVSDAFLVYSV